MADDIRRWSDELARDPASLVFLQLGEALRRQGQLDLALKSRCADSSGIRTTPTRTISWRASPSIAATSRARSTSGRSCCASRPATLGAMKGLGYRLLPAGPVRRGRAVSDGRPPSARRRRDGGERAAHGARRRPARDVASRPARSGDVAAEHVERSAAISSPTLLRRRGADGAAARRERLRARRRLSRRRRQGRVGRTVGARAERHLGRSASRDAASRRRRLDVDHVRDAGRGRRDGAGRARTVCSSSPRRARRRSGLLRRLLDRCARVRGELAGGARREATDEHVRSRRCSSRSRASAACGRA